MDQRLPPCAHRAPRLPVLYTNTSTAQGSLQATTWPLHPNAAYRPLPSVMAGMPTSTAQGPLQTTPWPHHPDAAYRPLMLATARMTTSDHGQTSTVGYSSSPYSMHQTLSQMGIASPGHVTRWWVREGHDGENGGVSYWPFPYNRPMPCGSDSETQDDSFLLPQPTERQMPALVERQMPGG
jgi:hypothetical protein